MYLKLIIISFIFILGCDNSIQNNEVYNVDIKLESTEDINFTDSSIIYVYLRAFKGKASEYPVFGFIDSFSNSISSINDDINIQFNYSVFDKVEEYTHRNDLYSFDVHCEIDIDNNGLIDTNDYVRNYTTASHLSPWMTSDIFDHTTNISIIKSPY